MIRTYRSNDQEAMLNIIRLNTPKYFAPSEEQDFANYLEHHLEDYYVVEDAGMVVAGGGINYFIESRSARISWDVVHPEWHGKGIGRQLVLHRVARIRENPQIDTIIVRTSSQAHAFYAKTGFVLEHTEEDFWAPGYDLYQMKMIL